MKLRFLSGVVICLVILVYLFYNYYYSVNFPYQDDFLLIQFIEVVSQGGLGFSGLITELFRTFNDHKAVVPRLISLIEYTITGHLNFRFYIVLVSINISYIFYFIYLQYKKTRLPLYYFIPAALLYFQPLYYDISGWALNGMQHSFLTAFTVTAIILASRRTDLALYGAMLCCFLATFTHGNGILSFPAIIFYFLCFKDFKRAIITGGFMILCLVIYLAGYESGQAVQLPKDLVVFFSSLFGFIGSAMSLWAFPVFFSAVWGAIILAFMIYIVWRVAAIYFNKPVNIKPGTAELLTLFAFIFITSSVIALFRSWAGSTIASRFQIYASLSTVIFYILLLDYTSVVRRKTVFYCITAFSIFYWVYSYYKFTGFVAIKRTTYLADVYNWKTNRNIFSVEKTITRNGSFYLIPGYEKGFFHLPKPIVERNQLDSMFNANAGAARDYQLYLENWDMERLIRDGVEHLTYSFVASNVLPETKGLAGDRFMVLRDQKTGVIHLMNANPKVAARKDILTRGHYYKAGFNTQLRQDDLAPGTYDMGILDIRNNGEKVFYKLDKSLFASGSAYSLK
ncbi:hypothetical protein [Dyadobacter psychrophilus]|uniref:Uncharacterized protein n=1 Tax=Dyadobacter psychrophilus TaxID=651661 RepID=A0A1T5C6E0_9BACT|nr:hypothetical protein [Dyadobacter psychrophilus]SKB54975.1 hypothetical protein SAMN05660293_00935 [Dyadobacter psychrophilus]